MGSHKLLQADLIEGWFGNRNYITNPIANDNTSGFSTYADAAATTPVDGTGGAPTVTLTQNTTTPLSYSSDFLITKDAANRQGEGISYDFSIDKTDQGKVIRFMFDYDFSDTDYTDDAISVFVYDVTNASLIYTSNQGIKAGKSQHITEFQSAINSQSYRVILHIAGTSAAAWTLYLSNFFSGRREIARGSVVTDLIEYTPTGSWVSNCTYNGGWKRVGQYMDLELEVNLTGAPTNTALTINLPSGYSIDTTKVRSTGTEQQLGYGQILDSGTTVNQAIVIYDTATSIKVRVLNASATYSTMTEMSASVPITFATGDAVIVRCSVPIVGWSSNANISSDFGGRIVSCRAVRSGSAQNISSTSETTIIFNSVTGNGGHDTVGGMNTSTGVYTVKEAGYYVVETAFEISGYTATERNIGRLSVAGVLTHSIADVDNNTTRTMVMQSGSVYCPVGSQIYASVDSDADTSYDIGAVDRSYISIYKISSPQTLMGSEIVSCKYQTNAGATIANSTATFIDFEDKVYDTHNMASGVGGGNTTVAGTGFKVTVPYSGKYRVTQTNSLAQSTAWSDSEFMELAIYKNTSAQKFNGLYASGSVSAVYLDHSISDEIDMSAGDYFQFNIYQSSGDAGGLELRNDQRYNVITVTKVN